MVWAMVLLALGLLPLALGAIEAFIYALRLPNHLAAVFPGRGTAGSGFRWWLVGAAAHVGEITKSHALACSTALMSAHLWSRDTRHRHPAGAMLMLKRNGRPVRGKHCWLVNSGPKAI